MNTTVYPTNYFADDDSFLPPQLFADESWEFGAPSHGLDLFSDVDHFAQDDFSSFDTLPSDEEVVSTPPSSSPNPYTPDCSEPVQAVQMSNTVVLAQYQQLQQYQLFLQQQRLLMSLPNTFPVVLAPQQATPQWNTPVHPIQPVETLPNPKGLNSSACASESFVKLTNLDTSHFGSSNVSVPKLKTIPVDISGNLSDAQYNKIFKKYHLQLQLDSHPTMSEKDLEDIKVHGRMYFLKNVKTIVPKIGPWKFNAHISHRRTDERQYNIPGMAVTCKVKEWLTEDGLWRLYHFKRGKTVKSKKPIE